MESLIKPSMSFTAHLKLTEDEASALDAICSYQEKDLLEVFYTHLGKSYLKPHELGFLSLVKSVREQLRPQLNTIKDVKKLIREKLK